MRFFIHLEGDHFHWTEIFQKRIFSSASPKNLTNLERKKKERERSERREGGGANRGEREEERNTCRSVYPAVPRGSSMRGIHILSAKHRPKPGEEDKKEVGWGAREGEASEDRRGGGRLRSEPETDELMLETAGGSCFRTSNDLAGATTRRWCWQHRWYARSALLGRALMLAGFIRADNDRELDFHRSRDSPRVDDRLSAAWSPRPSPESRWKTLGLLQPRRSMFQKRIFGEIFEYFRSVQDQ